jgi:thioredoxin 1
MTNLQQFQEFIKKEKAIVVDFHAHWCGPCKAIAPFFEKLAERVSDHVHFIKIDVDESADIAEFYNITGMPTFIAIYNGEEFMRTTGANKEELARLVTTIATQP